MSLPAQFASYEFLRILLPGYFAFEGVVVYLWLFLPELLGALTTNGAFFGILFVLGGVFCGLILYAIDYPARRKIFKESRPLAQFVVDRANSCRYGCRLPKEELEKNAHVMYWFVLDTRVPPQRRQRIYYFGSIYHIYSDIRLIMFVMIVGILTTLAAKSPSLQSCTSLRELLSISQLPLLVTAILTCALLFLTVCNKGDLYWRDGLAGQLLWLKLHPEIVDELICNGPPQ